MSRHPPLNPLRAFEATARHLSFSRAAAELDVTHSAISHQIRALEDVLQVKLFNRAAGRISLSPEGAALLPPISDAFEQIATAMSALSSPLKVGRLAISCVPGLLSLWLLPSIGTFCTMYPEVQLKLIPSNETPDAGNADVDIHICYGDGHWPQFDATLLSETRLFPVCHPSLLRDKSLRAVKDLFKHVLLHADDGREWKSWLLANNMQLHEDHRQHFLCDARLALEAASYGYGIALGDPITSRKALDTGQMIAPFEKEVPAAYSFYVLRRKGQHASPVIEAFTAWLHTQAVNVRMA